MSLYKGVLLFDIAEPPIGKWEEKLGYRGLKEVWCHSDNPNNRIEIELEDCGNCEEEDNWEIIHSDELTGNVNYLAGFDNYDEAHEFSQKWMKEHQNKDFAFTFSPEN